MKKYVFLTFAIYGIGGTQIYVRNKILFMQKKGWDVTVISTEPGNEICVKELGKYEKSVMPELITNPFLYTKKQRNAIINKMKSYVGQDYEQIIIESNFMQVSLWGEMLAECMGAKHFVYLIQEDYSMKVLKYLRFFDFKYERGELAGNTKYALKQLFEGYREIAEDRTGELTAVCYNTVEECESQLGEYILDADYHIGSIGRINKPFVKPMVNDIVRFAQKHNEDTFQLILLGGTPNNSDVAEIHQMVAQAKNLSVFISGAIFPIPRYVLEKMDVFVSSAGAARTSADEGYITITIDANDYKPIGILGYTTEDNVHRNPNQKILSTEQLLEEILYECKYKKIKPNVKLSSPDFMQVFEKHYDYVASSVAEKDYYNIKKLSPKKLTIIYYRIMNIARR